MKLVITDICATQSRLRIQRNPYKIPTAFLMELERNNPKARVESQKTLNSPKQP